MHLNRGLGVRGELEPVWICEKLSNVLDPEVNESFTVYPPCKRGTGLLTPRF
jgi:hypothetical protein